MPSAEYLIPDWPAPSTVRAVQTLRTGGGSPAPWQSLNLGDHVGDDPERVRANRDAIRTLLPAEPLWLQQVHGVVVADADLDAHAVPVADAAVARVVGRVCAVMTADCLPVLFCNRAGSVVAAAHAGWRGLLDGVLEATVQRMACDPADILVWLGPAIGPLAFEVGEEVRAAFVERSSGAAAAFVPHTTGKYLADLYALARQRLAVLGIEAVSGGEACTWHDSQRYFSYRRDGVTGRMASLIWLAPASGV